MPGTDKKNDRNRIRNPGEKTGREGRNELGNKTWLKWEGRKGKSVYTPTSDINKTFNAEMKEHGTNLFILLGLDQIFSSWT